MQVTVPGTAGTLEFGEMGSSMEPSGHPVTSFYSSTTIILGGAGARSTPVNGGSSMSWALPVTQRVLGHFEHGYLVFACARYYGGLHGTVFDSRVTVSMNRHSVDGFGIRKKARNHADYFLRIPVPRGWLATPLAECRTVYAWPITRDHLDLHAQRQVATVWIDGHTRWDIDHVGIVAQLEHEPRDAFLCHSWEDKDLARAIGAALRAKGLRIWIDEAEMRIGDTLAERLEVAVGQTNYLVVMVSRAAVNSPWVRYELELAMRAEAEGSTGKVLPIILDDCELPDFIATRVFGDLRDRSRLDIVVQALAERLRDRGARRASVKPQAEADSPGGTRGESHP